MLTIQDSNYLIAGLWADLAVAYGIVADAPSPAPGADVALAGPGLPGTTFTIKRFTRPIGPSTLQRLIAEAPRNGEPMRLLVIAPAASADVRRVADEARVSLVVAKEGMPIEGVLYTASGAFHLQPPIPNLVPARARGRIPWGTYAVAFALLEGPAAGLAELAVRAGVGRPRVSQILTQLGGLVERVDGQWVAPDTRALADWLAVHYPADVLLATTWATFDPPVRATNVVSSLLDAHGICHAISGDVAADRIAPWVRPATAWVWSATPVDLQPAGLTPAPVETANLTLAVSRDPHLLRSAHRAKGELPLLPGWRVWIDLVHQGRQDQANALADALVAGSAQ